MAATLSLAPDAGEMRRRLRDVALAPDILLGMPHLTPFGLSETWLLKELAHRHWLMLGERMGLADADFRNADRGEVYAAISALSLTGADGLRWFRPNDILTVDSGLEPAGSTSYLSRHSLRRNGKPSAQLELLSTFVQRAVPGRNSTLVRSLMPQPSTDVGKPPLLVRFRAVRHGEQPLEGIVESSRSSFVPFRYRPHPVHDFNGAGLLYFAHFQTIFDRALDTWLGVDPNRIVGRTIHYLSNLDVGREVMVDLTAVSPDAHSLCLTMRDDGGRRLAVEELLLG